jgi:HK97 family phage prohead protease
MPWHTEDKINPQCPVDKPWAVILDETGEVVQCHVSREDADTAVRALYTNVEEKGDDTVMHKMERDAEYKALDPSVDNVTPGTFSAVVAAYGNVDRKGDRIIEGAFDDSLAQWHKKGEPVPIILAHDWNNPFAHIGYVMPEKFKSVPGVGLVVEEGHLDIETNPTAAQVYRLMERKQLAQFSFGYTIPQGGMTKAMDGAFDLTQLNLVEVGPCLRGVNDQTQLLSIKAQLEAEDRELTIEERVSRLEAELRGKADDGPPQAPYDPQSAVKSMLVTANSFVEKVQEAAAADAMKEAIKAIQAVPSASPKPEFAGTKAEEPTGPTNDESVLITETEAPEVEEVETKAEEPKDPAEVSRELATLSLESQLRELEDDLEVKAILEKGKGDEAVDRLKNLEDELG